MSLTAFVMIIVIAVIRFLSQERDRAANQQALDKLNEGDTGGDVQL